MGRKGQAIQAAALALGIHPLDPQLPGITGISRMLDHIDLAMQTPEYEDLRRRRLAGLITKEQFLVEFRKIEEKIFRAERTRKGA